MTTAALGGSISFATLEDEELEIDIPAGTVYGETRHIGKRGVPRLQGGGRGDLVVNMVVETPKALDAEQEELLRQLATMRGESIDGPAGVVNRIKRAFR